jgi:hypothetical protein
VVAAGPASHSTRTLRFQELGADDEYYAGIGASCYGRSVSAERRRKSTRPIRPAVSDSPQPFPESSGGHGRDRFAFDGDWFESDLRGNSNNRTQSGAESAAGIRELTLAD